MNEQLYTFLLLAATGVALAFLFDCYRVTRNSLKLRWFATAVGDLLYWLLATAVVFLVLLKGNWGEIRFFVFLALFSGAGLYFRFISVYATAILGKTARTIGKVLRIIGVIISYLLFRPVLLPTRWLFHRVVSVGRRLYRWARTTKDGKPPEI
jgi:spore cortex biosynthesis protein YabQ